MIFVCSLGGVVVRHLLCVIVRVIRNRVIDRGVGGICRVVSFGDLINWALIVHVVHMVVNMSSS